MLVAIDGPAAAGKGLAARHLSRELDLPHLDTGLLYRIVAIDLLSHGHEVTNVAQATLAAGRIDLDRYDPHDLRAKHMGEAASVVSAIPGVRMALLEFQRNFADQPGGAILDGRDIGTVICPDAHLKIYMTANAEVRAARRLNELLGRGETISYGDVLVDIRKRDYRDSSRPNAPLTVATDAVLLDTTEIDENQVIDRLNDITRSAMERLVVDGAAPIV